MIPQLSTYLIRPLIACLAILHAGNSHAQEKDRWYQVELLIFSHESGRSTEQWEATPALTYPSEGRFLVDPGKVDANLANHHAKSVIDAFGRQILTLLPPTDAEEEERLTAELMAASQTPSDPHPATDPNEAIPDPNEPAADTAGAEVRRPTPFITLPAAQRALRDKTTYMQRSGRYRTLFHQTWVQPVPGNTRALPLILDHSGDTGDWPRLQGSITLYLSRYLHLKTNLWLNTQGDYLPGNWRMPPPPLGPPSLIIEELPPAEIETVAFGEQWLEPAPDSGQTEEDAVREEGDLEPAYPWRHAVPLQQKRRMRSNELHYVDHPLFGLVIKLTPLTEDDLDALALAEENGTSVLTGSGVQQPLH